LTFFKRITGRARPTSDEQGQHMLLAYAVFGFFAQGQARNENFHPSAFWFTPKSQNAHWWFAAEDGGSLRWYLDNAYRQSGPSIEIFDPIDDKHVDFLVGNDLHSFFYSVADSAEKPTVELRSELCWQGHFFWQEQGQDRAYGFEIVCTPKENKMGQSAIRFLIVRQVNQTPDAFFEELSRVWKSPISEGIMPIVQYMDLESPRIADRVIGGDQSALRRFAVARKRNTRP
jgi:hypothetical protein